MAGIVYYLPKMTGRSMDTKLLRFQFWAVFLTFNGTFISLIAVGIIGMPRRDISYAAYLQPLNTGRRSSRSRSGHPWRCSSGFYLAGCHQAAVAAFNPWDSLGVEWQVPTPVSIFNFDQVPVSWSLPVQLRHWKAGGRIRSGRTSLEWSLSMTEVSPTGLTAIEEVEGGGRTLCSVPGW